MPVNRTQPPCSTPVIELATLQDISGFPSFIQAGVKAIHPDHVELDRATTLQLDQTLPRHTVQPESSRLPYDYLVICTGAQACAPSLTATG